MLENGCKMIALICCRGGSKGIPGKNIKSFAGKPLLGWILEAAKEAEVFDDVVISTDSSEIAAVGQYYGATVPGLRPAHLATDTSNQFDTHAYIFDQLSIKDETHRVCILNNNPFVNSDLIRKGHDAAVADRFEHIALDAVRVGGDYLYFRQCHEMNGLLHLRFPFDMLNSGINRQGYATTYTTINNIRFAKPSIFHSYEGYKIAWLKGIIPVSLPKGRNFDLDTPEDWVIAEAVFKALHLK